MQDVSSNSKCDVGAVVDRQQPAVPTAGIGRLLQQRDLLPRLQVLFAQLDDVDALGKYRVQKLAEITAGAARIGAKIKARTP